MTDTNGQQAGDLHEVTQASIAGELGHIRLLLTASLAADRADLVQVVVGKFNRQGDVLLDSPTPRAKRLLVNRNGSGYSAFPLTTTPVAVLSANEGRVGGYAVCHDPTNAAVLFLCDVFDAPASAAVQGFRPAIFLPANAAMGWDFMLGQSVYGGPVCAAAAAATSALSVAEF